ncbi:MAG: ABC transporter ATP-binding protein [Cyanobacteria bacterium P01_H01_bin.121]
MLHLENLTKSYGSRLALDQLTLSIPPGQVYGLLGPNGAGKTTTINLICNLLKPDTGQITIAGQPVSDRTKTLVGVAPQENLLYRSLTCAENLHFFARIYGLNQVERIRRVYQCLDLVNLRDRANSPVETLSGGMQRRLSIAVALVHQPKLIILDEPTTGLDIEARYEVWHLINQLRQQGSTILLTTHLLEEAERLCQRIGIIRRGYLLAQGSLAALKHWIPAEAIALLRTAETAAVAQRASALGFTQRQYGQELALWLPTAISLVELLNSFAGIAIDSASIQAVQLEHVYLEITRQPQGAVG